MPGKIKYIFFIFIYLLVVLTQVRADKEEALLKVGDKAPDFTLNDPSGKPITLSSLKGKIILIDFWASWCGYCKIANNELISVYNTYKNNGFEIFSVSVDSKKEAWVNAINNQKLNWPYHGSDLKGWEGCKVSEVYNVEELPTTYLVDENGIIIGIGLDDYDLDKKLKWIFFEQIHFYPHVATTKLFFTEKAKFEVIDMKGKTILKGKDIEADISNLPPGDYIIKYEDKTDKFSKRNSTESLVTFFPERVDDKITLSREAEYEIYNMRGKSVKKGKATFIEAADLETGAYFLCIEGNVHSIHKK